MNDMFLLLCKSCRVMVKQGTFPTINIHTGKQNYDLPINDPGLNDFLEWVIEGYHRFEKPNDFDYLKNNTDELYFDVDNNFIRLYKLNGKGKQPEVIAMAKYSDPNWANNFRTAYADYLRVKNARK